MTLKRQPLALLPVAFVRDRVPDHMESRTTYRITVDQRHVGTLVLQNFGPDTRAWLYVGPRGAANAMLLWSAPVWKQGDTRLDQCNRAREQAIRECTQHAAAFPEWYGMTWRDAEHEALLRGAQTDDRFTRWTANCPECRGGGRDVPSVATCDTCHGDGRVAAFDGEVSS